MAAAAIKKNDMVVVGVIFFSLFLDIDGQSLRLRGPAINGWLFLKMLPKFKMSARVQIQICVCAQKLQNQKSEII